MNSIAVAAASLLVLFIASDCHGQTLSVTHAYRNDDIYGPVIDITCDTSAIRHQYMYDGYWTFNGKLLLNQWTCSSSSRYIVESEYVNRITITNAFKQDEGYYTYNCEYYIDGTSNIGRIQNTTYVEIHEYLPPLNYPKCSIEPGLEVTIGTVVTFLCDPGDSNPPVDFRVQRIKEFQSTDLNNREIQIFDHSLDGSIFSCDMRSHVFPTASLCNCAIGPLTIVEQSQPALASFPSTSLIPSSSPLMISTDPSTTQLSPNTFIYIVIPPVIVGITAIVIIAGLVWKIHSLKKIIASHEMKAVTGTDGPYLELQQASMSPPPGYMDLNGPQRGHEAVIHTYMDVQNASMSPSQLIFKAEEHWSDGRKHERNNGANWTMDDGDAGYIEVI